MEEEFKVIKEIKTERLNKVFNPSNFGIHYPSNFHERDALDERKKLEENNLYEEVVIGLTNDLLRMGTDIGYSSEILIREVAQNILLLNRVKFYLICRGPLRDKKEIKKESTNIDKVRYSDKRKQTNYYETYQVDEEINPLFNDLLPKIQKQINEGLKLLGLLPEQQLEKQKIIISRTLRQRLKDMQDREVDYSIKKVEQRSN